MLWNLPIREDRFTALPLLASTIETYSSTHWKTCKAMMRVVKLVLQIGNVPSIRSTTKKD